MIATKGGLERPGRTGGRRTAAPNTCVEACEGSLRRLGLEQIPLYQFHRPDPKVPLEESLGAIVELKDRARSATLDCATWMSPNCGPRRR